MEIVWLFGSHAMPPKFRDILAMLREDGWILVAQKGSHRQFTHPVKPGRVTVAGHPGKDASLDTYRSILQQAGLKR
jgi:predicted RNA binding protein YcfA (HicA-like mRNA interferase family)